MPKSKVNSGNVWESMGSLGLAALTLAVHSYALLAESLVVKDHLRNTTLSHAVHLVGVVCSIMFIGLVLSHV